MTTTRKLILGIASFLPIILYIVLIVVYAMAISNLLQNPNFLRHSDNPNVIIYMYINMFKSIIVILIPLFITSISLRIIYVILAVNNTMMNDTERIIWIIAIILFGTISFPIYFFLRVYGLQSNKPVS